MPDQLSRARVAVGTLVWLIEQAFQDDPSQSLLANLKDLREEDWTALPSGGDRSSADVLEHVGWCKWMYEDYAFGPGARMPNSLSGSQKVTGAGLNLSAACRMIRSWIVTASRTGASGCQPAISSAS